jgi:hypothetical protein
VTIAIRPSWRAGNGRGCRDDLGWARRSIFSRRGLDGANQVDCVGEICAIAHYRTRSPPIVIHRKYGFRSARLHFPTRRTMLACSNSACLRGSRREPVFLFASARGGFDAHGMLRSSSLAHLRWWRGGHWKRFTSIHPLALTSIPSGTPVCLRTCSPPLVALGCGTGELQKMRNLEIVVLGAALAGCASSAADIAPAYVSPVAYQSYTCQQLALEAQSISTRAATLSGAQDSQRTKDGVATAAAIVIFWPAAFFVGGDKQTAAELSQMKGQMVAVEQASIAKKCGIQFQGPRPPGT